MFSNCYGASVPLVANIDGNGNNNGWGADGGWLWFIVVIFAIFGGWGGNGFGFGGGGRDACATQADVRAAVDQQTLISKLDQQTYGLADSTFALNNTIVNGFHGVDNAICTLGYQNQQGFNEIAHQISDCCCTTQRAIDGVNYNLATQTSALQNTMCNNTRDIIDSQNAGTRAILDFLTQDKIATLTAENNDLRRAASQDRQNALLTTAMTAQTSQILDAVRPTPVPAYPAASPCGLGNWSPNVLANGYYNNGCGCNTGCGC